MARAAKRPDDLDGFPTLPVHTNLVEGVDLSALDLVVDAHTILTVRILFAVGVGDDDAIPVAARLGDLPGAVLPALRVPVANQYVHRARIDGFHTLPYESYTQDRRLAVAMVGCWIPADYSPTCTLPPHQLDSI